PSGRPHPDPRGQVRHPRRPRRDHHRRTRRDRHPRTRPRTLHDLHPPMGAREVRGQSTRLRRIHRDDARRPRRRTHQGRGGVRRMSSDFVRYSPEIETFDPKLSEYMTRIIDFWEALVRESPTREGSGRAVRGAHAKTIGVVRAEVEILGDAPAPYPQGIYAKPGRHDALVRFSSASNHLGPDAALGSVLGFAIKIFDVEGT